MVADRPTVPEPAVPGLIELGPADAPQMRALAEATRPGPFGARTHELGHFVGVRDGGAASGCACPG